MPFSIVVKRQMARWPAGHRYSSFDGMNRKSALSKSPTALLPEVCPVKLLREPNERALRLRQVSQLTGLSRSMIYQMQAEGRFPQRIKLGERAVGWLESEVRDWLATRIETSRGNLRGAS
jgi:prophage regulatory protein